MYEKSHQVFPPGPKKHQCHFWSRFFFLRRTRNLGLLNFCVQSPEEFCYDKQPRVGEKVIMVHLMYFLSPLLLAIASLILKGWVINMCVHTYMGMYGYVWVCMDMGMCGDIYTYKTYF